MKTVSSDTIIDLCVWLDDHLVKKPRTGRPAALSESELLTILLFSALTENHQRLSEIYGWAGRVYPGWFKLPNYANFVAAAHRHSRVRTPNDNAHLERFNRTLQEECIARLPGSIAVWNRELPKYLRHYNYQRPHMGIDWKTPMEMLRNKA